MSNKNQKAPLAPGLSRRGFHTLGGMAALGAGAALAGCAPQTPASGAAGGSDAGAAEGAAAKALAPNGQEYPWAAEPPAIADDMVEEEIDCDVCVIGLGVSGVAAFRAAAEAGAMSVGFEKGPTPQCRSSQYAYVNGSLSERLGLKADFDLEKVFEHEFNDCSQITNQSIVRKWLYHHTEAVDWWIEGGDCYVPGPGEVMGGNPMMGEPDPNHPVNVTSMSDPSIDYENENQAAYPENLSFSDHQAILDNNGAKAEAAGAVAYYGHFGEQVVKDGSGRVVGAYVRNAETGKYKKVNAAKGVVCSMGDGASNPDIMNFFYPHVVENGNFNPWPNMDVEGNLTNTGDVYPLGYWANAGFSQYQAPMIHVMGGPGDNGDQSVSMGFTGPLLRLNYNGKRFQNEDVAATECEFAFEKQPQKKAFMVFDAHFDEQAPQCINTFASSLQEMDARGRRRHLQGRDLEGAVRKHRRHGCRRGRQIGRALQRVVRCRRGRGLREEGEVPVARAGRPLLRAAHGHGPVPVYPGRPVLRRGGARARHRPRGDPRPVRVRQRARRPLRREVPLQAVRHEPLHGHVLRQGGGRERRSGEVAASGFCLLPPGKIRRRRPPGGQLSA